MLYVCSTKLEIQILDDSDDETFESIKSVVGQLKLGGANIHHIHRSSGRPGYKAGALKAGMKYAKGGFIAIFDADFVPAPCFLKKTISYFVDPKIGLVRYKRGHLNENYSSLTEAQAISLDLHFLIEFKIQKATPYVYVSLTSMILAGLWVGVIMLIFAAMRGSRAKLGYETT
ncbi:MAG: glycosyltransferase [Thermoproteota archaeon]|nr:glycosyltransferase [Thermoproteota archaeon]